jgi:hypothetical protein
VNQALALQTLACEHAKLLLEKDETGTPKHDCRRDLPRGRFQPKPSRNLIDQVCGFVWDRGHALRLVFHGCECPGCAPENKLRLERWAYEDKLRGNGNDFLRGLGLRD